MLACSQGAYCIIILTWAKKGLLTVPNWQKCSLDCPCLTFSFILSSATPLCPHPLLCSRQPSFSCLRASRIYLELTESPVLGMSFECFSSLPGFLVMILFLKDKKIRMLCTHAQIPNNSCAKQQCSDHFTDQGPSWASNTSSPDSRPAKMSRGPTAAVGMHRT